MKVADIRRTFFEFFASKAHQIVPSAPMVVKNDPTLMFTNAGMNQFKDYFLGNAIPNDKRLANSQKCLRVSGKHNDLEEVGVDTYHHTMFEMLGNWSFGDYFKKEAIEWAWELLTEVYNIPKDRLYVTVFEGDQKDNVPKDDESYEIWSHLIDKDRIILASKKDNFWEMGDTGPCGPCTEIHVDLRSKKEREIIEGKTLVNYDHPQVIEIWNNVFMQYNRKADGSLEPLPSTHVDTGMGLERLAMALQGKTSNYDTDLFQGLIQHMERISGTKYGSKEETDIALRVIADHIRAIAFAIADGQLPANNGAGYVIRRILRRAIRYGYQTLNLKQPFLSELSKTLGELMGDAYPELIQQKELIVKVILEEELSFFRTLEQGLKRIDAIIHTVKGKGEDTIAGEAAFELLDTYGFPIDLTSLIARENGLTIDEVGFENALQEQKERSRAATSIETEDWVSLQKDMNVDFIGYDHLQSEIQIIKYRKVTQKQKTFYQLVFNKTPFYAESGGQVGDSGTISNGSDAIYIFDTKKENNLIIHLSEKLPSDPTQTFLAKVDGKKRWATQANHSATHLMHFALREVLGTHVEQKGSLVRAENLRFDFSHFSKVTTEELQKIEDRVNELIQSDLSLEESRNTPIEKAKEMGAMALFGEKYGNQVRVIRFGDSIELCGGTHMPSTSKIGMFKILSESAVAAGIRRIEAITGEATMKYYQDKASTLDAINILFKNPKDILKTIEETLAKNTLLQKEVNELQKEQAQVIKAQIKGKITEYNGVMLLNEIVDLGAGQIKDILFQLNGEIPNFMGIIGGKQKESCSLSIFISETVMATKGLHAGKLVSMAAKSIHGGGGGQANFATAGGKNPAGLNEALDLLKAQL